MSVKYLQIEKLLNKLKSDDLTLEGDLSESCTVTLDKAEFTDYFLKPTQPALDLHADISGHIFYFVDDLDIHLNWTVKADRCYAGPLGVKQFLNPPILESVDLFIDQQPVRILDRHTKIPDHQVQKLLIDQFSNQIQSWKTLPPILAEGQQPTHLYYPDGLADIAVVPELSILDLRRTVSKYSIKQLASYYDLPIVDGEKVIIHGFTHFSLSEHDPMFVSLQWLSSSMIGSSAEPDLSLIETPTQAAVVLSGFTVKDMDGEFLSSNREVAFIMQLLHENLQKGWAKDPIKLHQHWLEKNLNSIKARLAAQAGLTLDHMSSKKEQLLNNFARLSVQNQPSLFGYEPIRLKPHNQAEYDFVGKLLGSETQQNNQHKKVFEVYAKQDGGWVCVINTYEADSDELTDSNIRQYNSNDSFEEIADFFGKGAIATRLIDFIKKESSQ